MSSPKSPPAIAGLKRANRFIFFLSLLGPVLAVGVIGWLYRAELQKHWQLLEGVADSHASLIEAVGAFDARHSGEDVEGGSFSATVSQVLAGQAASGGLGETGKIWIGVEEGGVLRVYGDQEAQLSPVPPADPGSGLRDNLARALAGETGRARFQGGDGREVLAFFQPVRLPEGTLALLVQIDARAFMNRFLSSAVVLLLLGGGLILLGWSGFVRVARPALEGHARLEKRFRTLLEGAEVPLLYTSEDGRVLEANPAAAAFVGLDREAFLGRAVVDFVSDSGFSQRLREEAWGDGHLLARTVQVRTESGDERWALVTAVASTAGDQEEPAMQILLQDVTRLKEAEETATRAREHLKALLAAAPVGLGVTVDRTLQEVSPYFSKMLGYEEGELVGQSARVLYPSEEEYLRVGREKYGEIRKSGAGVVETRMRRKDGRILDILLSSVALDPDDLSAGVVAVAMDVTEIRRIQKEVVASEARLRGFFDHIPGPAYIKGPDLRHLWGNPKALEVTGMNEEEFVSVTAADVLPAEQAEIMTRMEMQVLEEGVTVGPVENKLNISDRERWFSEVKFPIDLPDGTRHIGGIALDVTNEVETKRALLERERQLQLVADHVPAMVCRVDRALHYTFVNQGYQEFFGLPMPAFVGRPIGEIMGQELFTRVSPRIQAALAGEPQSFEIAVERGGEGARILEVEYVPELAPEGEIQGFVATMRDVTKAREAEARIQASEARYRSLFDANPLPYQSLQPDGTIQAVNPAWMETLGYGMEEVVGRPFESFLHSDDVKAFQAQFQELQGCGEVSGDRWRLRKKSGEYIWASCHGRAAYGKGKEPLQTHCVFRDVTSQVRRTAVEEARVRLMDQLPTASSRALTQAMVDEAQGITESSVGFLHILDPQGWRTEHQVWSTRTSEVCEAPGSPEHYSLDEAGAWADAARTGEPLIHNHPSQMDLKGTLPDGHVSLQRELLVPIIRGGEVQAVLGVGNKEEDYTRQDVLALQELADAAWDLLLRKQGEDALRESQERYRHLFESVNDPMVTHGMEEGIPGKILEVNSAALEMMGYSREEFQAMTPLDFQESPGPEGLAEISRGLQESGSAVFMAELRTREGAILPVEIRSRFFEFQGESLVISAVRDVSAWQEAQEEIRAQRDRTRLYLDTAGVMLLALDREGRIEMINRAGAEMLGWSEEELVGRPWFETALPPGVAREVRAVFNSAIQGDLDGVAEYENPILTRSGEERMIAWKNAFLEGEDGWITGSFSSGEDITEKRDTLRELENSRNRLMMLAGRLTEVRELERAALSRELHDELGQVLTGMRIELGILLEGFPDGLPDLRSRLLTLRDHMDQNIRQVRDLATFLRPPVFDVLGLTESIKWLAEELSEHSDLAVELDLEWAGDGILEDARLHFFRIFQEAFTNVLRHAEAEWVGARLRLEDGWVVGEVEDDGIGMPEGIANDPASLGLLGIEERVLIMDGHFDLSHGSDGGTKLSFRVHLAGILEGSGTE